MARLDTLGRRTTPRPLGAAAVGVGDWRDRAACAELPPAEADRIFFPLTPKNHRRTRRRSAEARMICGECPVRAECVTYALDNDEQFGVWGGLDEDDRRQLQSRMRGRKRQ